MEYLQQQQWEQLQVTDIYLTILRSRVSVPGPSLAHDQVNPSSRD